MKMDIVDSPARVGMDPDLKAKWIQALRSGVYQQGKSTLRSYVSGHPAYCCLGVLCDIMGRWDHQYNEGHQNVLTHQTQQAAGFPYDFNQMALVRLNDLQGASFNQIADYIEENL